jgi:N,N'-diacetyllegionaminate synthase
MDFFAQNYAFADSGPTVVIGEIGVNHNGDSALARRLVDVAVAAGVHIVKFQAFKSEEEISRFAALAPYQQLTSSDVSNQLELCKALELPASAFRNLKQHCTARGVGFLSSAFDFESVDFLVDKLKVRAIKIASGEVTNLPFLEYIGSRKVGVILSTGASTLEEVKHAVAALRRAGCPELVLLHCVSSYPAPVSELNLRAMQTLKTEFGVPVGFSDHSLGIKAAITAAALGAVVIEKHFTLDRTMRGPDHAASLEPDELKRLVKSVAAAMTLGDGVKLTNEALGDGIKRPMPSEMSNLPLIRKSLVASGRLRQGDRLTRAMIAIKRPAEGIAPGDLDQVIGRRLNRDLADDEPITWNSLD